MTAVLELLLSGIIRTTLCTTLAAAMALGLLRVLRTRSTRVHRVAWVLVILQGWVLVPVTFTVLEQRPVPVEQSSQFTISYVAAPQLEVTSAKPPAAQQIDWWEVARQAVVAVWLLGTGIVFGVCLWRYYALVARIPLGSVSKSTKWNDEWREVTAEVTANKNVCFRVTHQVGPLLCFVPFVYLVLVPRLLWGRLSREDRLAILRHELAHLQHGDLWKNVLIRLFALPQWFNPLVWLAVHRFEEAGEWACDEAVIASSTTAKTAANTDYASTLLRVAGFATDAPCGAVAATGGKLTRRVTRLLASTNKEVLQMKDLLLVVLLLTIALGQAIRIESVYADKPAQPTSKQGEVPAEVNVEATPVATLVALRAEQVAKWRSSPYVVEPPDILLISIALPTGKQDTLTDFEVKELNKQQQHLVGPDGRVNFGPWGTVYVAGKTLKEINTAIERQLGEKLENPQVSTDVFSYNSKVYYAIIQGGEFGDNVNRLPLTCNETVLDAIANIAGTYRGSISKIWISQSAPNGVGKDLILPVNWKDIISNGISTATNYQLLPGDRLFVETKSKAVVQAQAETPILKQPPPTEAANRIRSSSQTVKVKIQFIEDIEGNLSELEGLDKGDTLIGDARSTLGLLRILDKNKLIHVDAATHLTIKKEEAGFVRCDFPSDSSGRSDLEIKFAHASESEFNIEVTYSVNQKATESYFKPTLQKGQTCLLRLVKQKGTTAGSRIYVAVTRVDEPLVSNPYSPSGKVQRLQDMKNLVDPVYYPVKRNY